MYTGFYRLQDKPFSKTPDPRYLFRSTRHTEALARLQYAVEERELAVLTGGIGSGKTLLSRALMDSLDEEHPIALVVNPSLSPIQFLRTVAQRLGVAHPDGDKGAVVEQIHTQLYAHDEKGKCPVVILDEAQLIEDRHTFDEIRLLTNFQLDDRNLLAVILIGQPELRQRLLRSPFRALRQRIGILYHLRPLSRLETREYIMFRLSVAGRTAPLFTDDAVSRVYTLSHGVPREINNICSCALLEGYGRDAALIDRDVIDDVGRDMGYSLLRAGPAGRRKKRLKIRRSRILRKGGSRRL